MILFNLISHKQNRSQKANTEMQQKYTTYIIYFPDNDAC